jgi:hypothetical protein
MAAGGIIVLAWLFSHLKIDAITKLFGWHFWDLVYNDSLWASVQTWSLHF